MNKLFNRNCCFIFFLNIYLFRVPNLKQRNSSTEKFLKREKSFKSVVGEADLFR